MTRQEIPDWQLERYLLEELPELYARDWREVPRDVPVMAWMMRHDDARQRPDLVAERG